MVVHEGAQACLGPCWEVSKALGAGVEGALKAADGGFVAVAGVDHQGVGIINEVVPIFGIHVGANVLPWVHARHPHRDDLFFRSGLKTTEHGLISPAAFHLQPLKMLATQGKRRTQALQQRFNPRFRAANRAVHPFMGHQN